MNRHQEFLDRMAEIFNECLETAENKNADYASSDDPFQNFRLVERMGVTDTATGIFVRLTDKCQRIANLLGRDAQVKDEAVVDTISDAINYLAILRIYLEQEDS